MKLLLVVNALLATATSVTATECGWWGSYDASKGRCVCMGETGGGNGYCRDESGACTKLKALDPVTNWYIPCPEDDNGISCTSSDDCSQLNDGCIEGICVDGNCEAIPNCVWGTYNEATKLCDCDHPYCPDSTGACTIPMTPGSYSCSEPPKCLEDCAAKSNKCETYECGESGQCVLVDSVDCTGACDQCVLATCDPAYGTCTDFTSLTGSTCDDSNSCTTNDKCHPDGSCSGTPMDCSQYDTDCKTYTCSNGQCVWEANVGDSCSDGNSCTMDDKCNANGECAPGPTMNCKKHDTVCKTFSCNADTGMCDDWSPNVDDSCDDYDGCTQESFCDSQGSCVGVEDCSHLDGKCHIGYCDQTANSCDSMTTSDDPYCCSSDEHCKFLDISCLHGVCIDNYCTRELNCGFGKFNRDTLECDCDGSYGNQGSCKDFQGACTLWQVYKDGGWTCDGVTGPPNCVHGHWDGATCVCSSDASNGGYQAYCKDTKFTGTCIIPQEYDSWAGKWKCPAEI